MLDWYIISSADYEAAKTASKLSDEYLYFLSDTHQIMRGATSFTDACELYTGAKPATPAANRLYINSTTLEGSVYSATSKTWTTVIHPVAATVSSDNTVAPVSGKAVADYVAEELAKVTGSNAVLTAVTYDKTTRQLSVTDGTGAVAKTTLDGLAVSMNYEETTGALTIADQSGAVLSTVNLDLERFVSDASFDPETNKITLKFNDNQTPLEIDVAHLVDTYTVDDTATVDLTMDSNKITADVKVSAVEGNTLLAKDDGLYVATVDQSAKMDKVAGNKADEILVADAAGNAALSGKKVGGATLSASADANTVATEAAVEAIRAALQANIDAKIAKVATGKADEVLIATADGQAAVSGVKIGGEAFAQTPDAATLATEKGVAAHVTSVVNQKITDTIVTNGNLASSVAAASDTKVASEKALLNALTWKTAIV